MKSNISVSCRKSRVRELCEIRKLASTILVEAKPITLYIEQFDELILREVKKQGYSKISSRKASAFLKTKTFTTKIKTPGDNYYVSFGGHRKNKKEWERGYCLLQEHKIGEGVYHLNFKSDGTLTIFQPHFFEQYQDRVKTGSFEGAISDFLYNLFSENHHPTVKKESVDGDINMKFPKGMALGNETFLGIQKTKIIYFKTFIDNGLMTEEQKGSFAS